MTTFSVERLSIIELARQGNFRAIADWINSYLLPQGIEVKIESRRAKCLKITVEFERIPPREHLVRFICHCLWKLNSDMIEGARIIGQLAGESKIVWEQSVRILTPAYRQKRSRSRSRTHHLRQKSELQFRIIRSLLVSGVAIAAFIFGCWFSYTEIQRSRSRKATVSLNHPQFVSPTSHFSAKITPPLAANRPKTVQAALETVPVVSQPVLNPKDPSVTMMFGGDVSLAYAFEDALVKDYSKAFSQMEEYRNADVAMVNLEHPLTKATTMQPNQEFNFKAPPESVKILKEGGVGMVTLANNHMMDYEVPGLDETIKTLEQAGIHHIGAGRDQKETERPEILEVKGQRIAYLGYYCADIQAADQQTTGTNYGYNERIEADIKALRNQVDWIVVNFHWGNDLANHPEQWQIDLARFAVDQGADVVIGHHAQVLQGAEIYKGRPIAYSLGNFIFGGKSYQNYDTAVLKVAVKDQQMKVEFIPVEVRNNQPKVITGDRGNAILKNIERMSSMFDEPMKSPMIIDAVTKKVLPTGQGLSNPGVSPKVNNISGPFNPHPFIATPSP